LLLLLSERDRREAGRKLYRMFPDETRGEYYARHLYPRHIEHFEAGRYYRERCFMAGNRVGKTVAGAYEAALHLTGIYPEWWPGKRFHKPTRIWAAGKTNETTRDIVQRELLGEVAWVGNRKTFTGTGMIPQERIGDVTWKAGVADLADVVRIGWRRGMWSTLGFKSFNQGRGAFEGTAQHGVWFDEEPPVDVYGEALIRTATTNGLIWLTFTPLEGMSDVVMQFLPRAAPAAT
jgi:phage terminase large subunit-like protein